MMKINTEGADWDKMKGVMEVISGASFLHNSISVSKSYEWIQAVDSI